MRHITKLFFTVVFMASSFFVNAQEARHTINLNGIVEFEQTKNAQPPKKFTRKIPVPGLIDLAKPKIEQYDEYFQGTHKPRYSWYKFTFKVDKSLKDRYAVLKILKSRYSTQVLINGHDVGTYEQNNTPIQCNLTPFLKIGKKNELLVRIGDRAWMSNAAATGFDREKFTDIPGIWDDVSIDFTGPVSVDKVLILPSMQDSSITAKIMLDNLSDFEQRSLEYSSIEYDLNMFVREKVSKKVVTETLKYSGKIKSMQDQYLELNLNLKEVNAWSPNNPFLYEAVITVEAKKKYIDHYGNPENLVHADDYAWLGASDDKAFTFGMRSFKNVGKSFELNGEEFRFFGTSLTLNRFFEDPNRAGLPWDREWVEKFLVSYPKAMGWNFFRVHIGLLPDFWYELADKHGFVIQNEYPMWNLRGRNSGYQKEYTDWIWADGNHPSIVIWDALNEQRHDYIGNTLIPELRKLDPSRVWDAGWMSAEELSTMEMIEVHWYALGHGWWDKDEKVYRLREAFVFGEISKPYREMTALYKHDTPIILNEFVWLWQNRDGLTSSIRTYGSFTEDNKTPKNKDYEYYEPDGTQVYGNRDIYEYYLGKGATADQRWDFQAYMTNINIEIIRATREVAGIASFTYIANNGGHVGDWFKAPIADLIPTQALLAQHHSMREFGAYIDFEDGRYNLKPKSYATESTITFNVLAVNDAQEDKKGKLTIKLVDANNKETIVKEFDIELIKFWQKYIPMSITLPSTPGGYAIISELNEEGSDEIVQKSIRFINVGDTKATSYPTFKYDLPATWPAK